MPTYLTANQREAFRAAAAVTPGIDVDVYDAFDRDWRDPIFGLGPTGARVCIFGRDPGRTEVEHLQPFIGKGGQLVRRALHAHRALPIEGVSGGGTDCPATLSLLQSIAAGSDVFWLNTVPYKPIGNRAWSTAVKRRFQPLVADLLLHAWLGSTDTDATAAAGAAGAAGAALTRRVIVLGREAFFWFGIGQTAATNEALQAFWAQGDSRYEGVLPIEYTHCGASFPLSLAPLPHPSPANAVWATRFPGLMKQRLRLLRY